ncbi:MAG TPA: SGNH/GDSL hydrolase family protein [Gemmataceae bacterium]
MRRTLLPLALALTIPPAATAAGPFFLRGGERVVFLGDSITFAGDYIAVIDAYLFARFPDKSFELINLGLPSETVTGLTETDHPFPRPDVHDRLARALEKTRPGVVVACYGMNDGIYHPFGADRFRKYQQGIEKLIEKVKQSGARLVLMTPPPFDPVPVRDRLAPGKAKDFGYKRPYRDYDEVLARYAAWLLTLRDRGIPVVDLHTPLNEHLAGKRKTDPKYTLAPDGVHPNAAGHRRIARELLRAWHAPDADAALTLPERQPKLWELAAERQRLLGRAWLDHVGHTRPQTPKGLPLAEAKERAAGLERQIRELVTPPKKQQPPAADRGNGRGQSRGS